MEWEGGGDERGGRREDRGVGRRGRSDADSLLKYMCVCVYINVDVSSACYCITRVHTCVHAS